MCGYQNDAYVPIVHIFSYHLVPSIYFSMNDSGNVIKRIEAISSVVIEESDDIHSELASCVLQNLTKEAEVIPSICFTP